MHVEVDAQPGPIMVESKFADFVVKDFVYKTVHGHPIETTVCIHKNVAPSKRPLLVHLHGGFLIIGDKMFEPWFANWLIKFAESKGAVIVSPNYRLIPEAIGEDIMEDLRDFYDWVKSSLPAEVTQMVSGVEVDLSKILVAGESAGGYLAAQSALCFPDLGISAVISQYGMLDIEHHHFSLAYHKKLGGCPPVPNSIVDDYVNALAPGAVRSSTIPPRLWVFIISFARQGYFHQYIGEDDEFYPIRLLDKVKDTPPFWIIHGTEDDLVPHEISDNFVVKMKSTHPQTPLLYTLQPGGHGFDDDSTIDEEWVKKGCDFISEYWP